MARSIVGTEPPDESGTPMERAMARSYSMVHAHDKPKRRGDADYNRRSA